MPPKKLKKENKHWELKLILNVFKMGATQYPELSSLWARDKLLEWKKLSKKKLEKIWH